MLAQHSKYSSRHYFVWGVGSMRRIIILVGLLFVATTVVVGLRNRQVVGLLLKCHTFTVDSACYTNVVEQRLHDNPDSAADAMKQIATLRRLGLLGGDFRLTPSCYTISDPYITRIIPVTKC